LDISVAPAVAVLFALVALLVVAPAASASCAQLTDEQIAAADTVVIGTVESVEGGQPRSASAKLRIQFSQDPRIAIGDLIDVSGAAGDSSIVFQKVQERGLLLERDGSDWSAAYCGAADPVRIEALLGEYSSPAVGPLNALFVETLVWIQTLFGPHMFFSASR
jgi:hypothetical protein